MDANLLNEAAIRLRDSCLANASVPDLDALNSILEMALADDRELAVASARALIRTVVEELSDRFNPELSECYVNIFTRTIAAVIPSFSASFLRQRYADLCAAPSRPLASGSPEHVIVLSRITLGADIAITSVFLRALRLRFPAATLWFAGPAKNFELFAGMPNVRHWPIPYPRAGTLAERFAVVRVLDGAFDSPGTWLMDPDSRISQLGLLPVAPLRSSLFFESRSISPESNESLSSLASGWCEEHLGVGNALPEIAPAACDPRIVTAEAVRDGICLSLGVGNNEAKRLSGRFEAQLLRLLVDTGRRVWIDSGAGGLEADSVNAAVAASGVALERVQILTGSFSDFCRVIQGASLYVGYDSAGQHAAAALGVPSITLFKGHPNDRMLHRWHPRGVKTTKVIRIDPGTPEEDVFHEFVTALRDVVSKL